MSRAARGSGSARLVGLAAAAAAVAVLSLAAAVLAVPAGSDPVALGPGDQAGGCTPLDVLGLAAQVLGAANSDRTAGPALTDAVAGRIGTVVLLGGAIADAEQVRRLVADLDAAAPAGIPPVIAVDEEGGRVARFGRAGVTAHLPSAREQAATQTPDQVRAAAASLGAEMAALGVDLDLAPVLDLSDDPAGSIIGDRSFSADPAVAGAYGAAFAAGLRESGIATSAKHFPDHGLTAVDTHTGVAVVDVGLDALRTTHLAPYRTALPHLDSVMLSHLRISSLDPDLPASLSPAAVALLRAELADPATGVAYDGVVITDDLSMQAVAAVADQATAARLAIAAGADLALVGSVAAAGPAHAHLVESVDEGVLSRARLAEAARRVLTLKGLTPSHVECLAGPSHYSRPR